MIKIVVSSVKNELPSSDCDFALTLHSYCGRCAVGAAKSGYAVVDSSLRRRYPTKSEISGDSLSTGAGLRWDRSYSRPLPLKVWSASNSTWECDGAGESDSITSRDGGRGGGKRDGGWLCICNSMQSRSINDINVPMVA